MHQLVTLARLAMNQMITVKLNIQWIQLEIFKLQWVL
jgi:hypothetical protein